MVEMSREYRLRTETFDKKVRFVRSTYSNGSMRLILYTHAFDIEGYHWYEPYIDFTADLNINPNNKYCAFVRNHFGEMVYDWLSLKGIGTVTDFNVPYGNQFYTLVEFDKRFIDRLYEFDGQVLPSEISIKSMSNSSLLKGVVK